ncbi:MAG: ribonuclease III [Elusimicrobia bacterium]|nr:ribonuclease III [Elusimicrobiota bacterium]
MTESLEKSLEKLLGFKPRNISLFRKAFTHKTLAIQRGRTGDSNELLEFLGDSVLNFYITRRLFEFFPSSTEGALTRKRSYLVNTRRLAKVSSQIGLGKFLKVGDSFEGEVSDQPSILADTLEALIGAMFLDGGWEKVSRFIESHFEIEQATDKMDSKSKLQEITQKKTGTLPKYRVVSEKGVPHRKSFLVEVFVNGRVCGRGSGSNKKSAEEEAAKAALAKLGL